jgi:hypothetical protein
VTDQLSTVLYKFDVESGAQLAAYELYLPIGNLCGYVVYFGYRAGTSPALPPITPPLPDACPPGNLEPRAVTGLDGCPVTL